MTGMTAQKVGPSRPDPGVGLEPTARSTLLFRDRTLYHSTDRTDSAWLIHGHWIQSV